MKISYTGLQSNLPPRLQEKLDTKFAKLSKMIDGRGEKKAHVVLTSERHLHKAEITLNFHDHQLVGIGSDSDVFNAMNAALLKIEKQAVKQSSRWREKTRRNKPASAAVAEAQSTSDGARGAAAKTPRLFRSNHHERRKPITLEEAMLLMEDGRDYLAYRDADKECLSILIRRRDGHFDLIES